MTDQTNHSASPAADDRREQIEARLRAATKGPWFWRAFLNAEGSERTYAGYPQRIMAQDDGLILIAETFDGHEDEPPPHALLIANAPSDLAYLLSALTSSEEQRDAALRHLDKAVDNGVAASRRANEAEAQRDAAREALRYAAKFARAVREWDMLTLDPITGKGAGVADAPYFRTMADNMESLLAAATEALKEGDDG